MLAKQKNLYEYEISRFQELLQNDQKYAFERYGLTLLYSLPPEETFQWIKDFGWKGKEALDYYNQGTLECQEGKFKEALKNFKKAESMDCEQPELFFNIAAVHEELGNTSQAKEYYQKYIDAVEKYDEIPKSLQKELDEVREHLKTL